MSRSYSVQAISEPDDKHAAMLLAFDACKKANVSLPPEIERYFENGVCRDGKPVPVKFSETHDQYTTWYSVEIGSLPSSAKIIRFGVS